MEQINLHDKYPNLFTSIADINSNEDMDVILIKENELEEIYEGDTRLFGFYNNDGELRKMTLLSLINSRLDSVDYYLSSGGLFYVIESSDLLTMDGAAIKEESRHSKYIFKDNQISDYERVGNHVSSFDKVTIEGRINSDTLRNVQLLAKKRTENKTS